MQLSHNAVLSPNTLQPANTEDPGTWVAALPAVRAVALHFPKWTDGRAYSQARLLRSRLGWKGPLIATGDVLIDMLPLLQRCGFDAAHLRADQDLAAAQRALGYFDGHRAHYQADLVSLLPRFSRPASA